MDIMPYNQWSTEVRPMYGEQIRVPQIPADATPERRQALIEVSYFDRSKIITLTPEDQQLAEAFVRLNKQLFELALAGDGPQEAPVVNLEHEMIYYIMGKFDPMQYGHVLAVGIDGTYGVIFQEWEAPQERLA